MLIVCQSDHYFIFIFLFSFIVTAVVFYLGWFTWTKISYHEKLSPRSKHITNSIDFVSYVSVSDERLIKLKLNLTVRLLINFAWFAEWINKKFNSPLITCFVRLCGISKLFEWIANHIHHIHLLSVQPTQIFLLKT